VEVLSADLSDLSVGKKAVELAVSSFGRLDGLVLNHGSLGPVGRIADFDAEAWKTGYDTNFFSAVAFVSEEILLEEFDSISIKANFFHFSTFSLKLPFHIFESQRGRLS
jgi:NAD(P)-dependent dehydrogenase (short-subunit alcohol dehydrogenase family)